MPLSDKLKLAREKLGKTQQEMAEILGISKRGWQTYEEGKSIPGGKVFEALSRLRFNTNWFFSDDVPMLVKDIQPVQDTETSVQPEQDTHKTLTMPSDSLGMAEGMTILGRIYSSGDQVFIRAINANLHAFNEALDNKALAQRSIAQLNQMEKRMSQLESRLSKIEQENEDLKKKIPGDSHQANG
jgi:transcriptional regulator with XRE-family HTH domain